jgi:hypothetical protein
MEFSKIYEFLPKIDSFKILQVDRGLRDKHYGFRLTHFEFV